MFMNPSAYLETMFYKKKPVYLETMFLNPLYDYYPYLFLNSPVYLETMFIYQSACLEAMFY